MSQRSFFLNFWRQNFSRIRKFLRERTFLERSVLRDASHFGGSTADLEQIAGASYFTVGKEDRLQPPAWITPHILEIGENS